jgi:hypothetical protein
MTLLRVIALWPEIIQLTDLPVWTTCLDASVQKIGKYHFERNKALHLRGIDVGVNFLLKLFSAIFLMPKEWNYNSLLFCIGHIYLNLPNCLIHDYEQIITRSPCHELWPLMSFLAYSLLSTMQVTCSSETQLNFQRTNRLYLREDSNFLC